MPTTTFALPGETDTADYRTPLLGWLRELLFRIERSRQRAALRELAQDHDEHLLKDIGKSRAEALKEAAKPFWQSWGRPLVLKSTAGSMQERACAGHRPTDDSQTNAPRRHFGPDSTR